MKELLQMPRFHRWVDVHDASLCDCERDEVNPIEVVVNLTGFHKVTMAHVTLHEEEVIRQ